MLFGMELENSAPNEENINDDNLDNNNINNSIHNNHSDSDNNNNNNNNDQNNSHPNCETGESSVLPSSNVGAGDDINVHNHCVNISMATGLPNYLVLNKDCYQSCIGCNQCLLNPLNNN